MSAVIDHMTAHYRLAGSPVGRDRLKRRLDRAVAELLPLALEDLTTSDETDQGGAVICLRRLRLSLWLNATQIDEAGIAQQLAKALIRGFYKQIAEAGPDEVMRFASEPARLAAWATDVASGMASDKWYWNDFAYLQGVAPGRAIAAQLGRDEPHIGAVMRLLSVNRHRDLVLDVLQVEDVVAIWTAWLGIPPQSRAPIGNKALQALVRSRPQPPVLRALTKAGVARHALSWLITLSAQQDAAPVDRLGDVAMQLSHLSALGAADPNVARALSETPLDLAALRVAISDVAEPLENAAAWLRAALDRSRDAASLKALAELAFALEPGRPAIPKPRVETRHSAYTGAGLLLPAIARLGLYERLGPVGLQELLAASVGLPDSLVARHDPGLRWLSGLPDDPTPVALSAPVWPEPKDLGLRFDPKRDADSHGAGPEMPALRAVADAFSGGLRGMEESSLDYLARQFFHRPGTLIRDDQSLTLRIDGVPLGILLRMTGRLGEAEAPDCLGGRKLVVGVARCLTVNQPP